MRKILVALVALVAGLAFAFAGATVATAHSELEESNPAQGATVGTINKLVLTFGEGVVPDYSTVVLTDAVGVVVELDTPTFDTTSTIMTIPIVAGALPNGDYIAGFRIVSVDGHPIAGEVDFTVAGSDAPALVAPSATNEDSASAAPEATEEPSATDGTTATVTLTAQNDGPNMLVVVGTVAAALGALALVTIVLLIAIRRNRAKPTDGS